MMRRLALFIHRITLTKRTREVRSALLVRESNTQLLMYSLDMYIIESVDSISRDGPDIAIYVIHYKNINNSE